MNTIYILKWNFHVCTITTISKEIEERVAVYYKFEDLLKDYRKLKEAKFMEWFSYNTDFKVYKCEPQNFALKILDDLL